MNTVVVKSNETGNGTNVSNNNTTLTVATAAGRGWRRGRGKWQRGNTGQRFRPAVPY